MSQIFRQASPAPRKAARRPNRPRRTRCSASTTAPLVVATDAWKAQKPPAAEAHRCRIGQVEQRVAGRDGEAPAPDRVRITLAEEDERRVVVHPPVEVPIAADEARQHGLDQQKLQPGQQDQTRQPGLPHRRRARWRGHPGHRRHERHAERGHPCPSPVTKTRNCAPARTAIPTPKAAASRSSASRSRTRRSRAQPTSNTAIGKAKRHADGGNDRSQTRAP